MDWKRCSLSDAVSDTIEACHSLAAANDKIISEAIEPNIFICGEERLLRQLVYILVENAVKYSTIHPRCGTSFILMAFIMMIIIFTFVGQTVWYWRAIIKIALMPLVAGISYEVFRLPLKFPNSIIVKALVAPGLWMQKLTTAEPDLAMLEVAMSALKAVPEYIPTEKDAALLREQEMQAAKNPLEAPADALPEQMKLDKKKENQAGYASATVWNG